MKAPMLAVLLVGALIACQTTPDAPSADQQAAAQAEPVTVFLSVGGVT